MEKATKVECCGEAHTNAYIDHCGVCAPNWGYWLVCPKDGTRLKGTKCPKCRKVYTRPEA